MKFNEIKFHEILLIYTLINNFYRNIITIKILDLFIKYIINNENISTNLRQI